MTHEIQRIVRHSKLTVRHTSAVRCEFQSHSHNWLTVTAILEGRLSVVIGPAEFKLSKGQVALTNAGETHSAVGERVEFVSISISPALISDLLTETGSIFNSTEAVFIASVVGDEAITAAARSIIFEMATERVGRASMLEALVRQVAVHLIRSHLSVRRSALIELSRAGPVDRRLRRAIEFMHDNYSRDIPLEEIASTAYLSEFHFARLFKQIMGVTPHFYLANLRIERARALLLESDDPIGEIAVMVGYQSQSHFTKIFKSVTGLTPHAFRNADPRKL
jgi:AraC family transcriptional regulator